MLLFFALLACLLGSPGWALFWIIWHLLDKDDK